MNTKSLLTASVLAALGLGIAGLPAAAQGGGPGDGPGMGPGMGPGGGPCMMMLEWFDENGDGRITAEEFRAGHDERFAEMDADRDGKVTIEEFQAAPKPSREVRKQRMFKRMDSNGDGVLTRNELDSRAEMRFENLDVDGDKVITIEEIRQSMPPGHGPGSAKGAGASGPPR